MTDGKSDNGKYRIQHIGDFLAVPEDELDACLEQFKEFLRNTRRASKACHGRIRWMLKEYDEADRDEFIGGMTIIAPKRFLFRSKKPRESGRKPGLPPPSEIRTKLNRPPRRS